ncbi:MAG TPA: PadR family transcriptional regulator [Thermoanaerobaculia bacterium]|nr:PadR family transcriptional regulator [Thermoanaerobaculia bacterium]
MSRRTDLLQGSLDLLILKTLELEPLHGWAVSRRIRRLSEDVLEVNQGSLYPALYRLRDRGLITSELGESEEGRPVKVYRLTAKGAKALAVDRRSWRRFADAVDAVLAAS